MEEKVLIKNPITTMDKSSNIVLDIESLMQLPDKSCSGSPKLKKALSRKSSWRLDKRNVEDQEVDHEASKKLIVKVVPSQLEQLKQPLIQNKALIAVQSPGAHNPISPDSGEGKCKRAIITIHPRKILLLFATVSCIGTMILIYFTLSINRRNRS